MIQLLLITLTFIINTSILHAIESKEDDYKTVVVHGSYSKNITLNVNASNQYVIHFGKSESVYPYTIFASSTQSNFDYPIFVMVTQQKEATSWEIPLMVKSKEGMLSFWNTSRTLCHNNINAIADIPRNEFYSINGKNGFYKHLTVSVSTVSDILVDVTIRVEEETDFYVIENQTYSVIISPSQPKYFYYKYHADADKDIKTTDTVILEVDSGDETCLTVSIQDATCPVFDLNEDITYEGKYETVNTRGGVIIKKSEFPEGFFVVFVAKGDNYDCDRKHSLIPLQIIQSKVKPLNYSSAVTFKIKESITKTDYLRYTFTTVGIILGLGVLFGAISITSLCLQIKRMRKYRDEENQQLLNTNSIQYEGTSGNNTTDHNEQLQYQDTFSESYNSIFQSPYERISDDNTADPDDIKLQHMTTFLESCNSFYQSPYERISDDNTADHDDIELQRMTFLESCNSFYQSCISNDDPQTAQQRILENSIAMKAKILELSKPTVDDILVKTPRLIYKESRNYCLNAITIGIFYGIPVFQLVVIHQRLSNKTGNLDICYYNFLCAHPYSIFNDYNHVLSNIGYIGFGLLFLLITLIKECIMPQNEDCGIPKHYGNYYALGVALTMEGLLSGSYHVCPNQSNFQFDTSFMYVMAVLCIINLYQNRHPGINANAYFTFLLLAVAVLIAMVGILDGHIWIWVLFILLYIVLCMFLACKVYFINQSKSGLAVFFKTRKNEGWRKALKPLRKTWCKYLGVALIINIIMAAMGFLFHARNVDFGTFLLILLMGNAVLYVSFYIVMKCCIAYHQKKNNKKPTELPTLESICYLLLAIITWGVAVKFFVMNSSQWMVSPAKSRQRNTECKVMDFYDNHDIWHFSSASALFFSFMFLLTLDDNLIDTPRSEMVVF